MPVDPPTAKSRSESAPGHSFTDELRRIATAGGREQRSRAIDDLARAVTEADAALPFIARLANSDRHGKRMALEIALRLPLPLPPKICLAILPLLGSATFPTPLRLNVLVQSLRSLPGDGVLAHDLLQALIHSANAPRAMEWLRYLQRHLPEHAGIDRLQRDLEQRAAIPCPRCSLRLQRPELVPHLWLEHGLLMEGNRVLEPWRLIADWVSSYANTGRPELLERSCELAQQIDPEGGLTGVHRLMLAAGLTNDEAAENLTRQARGRRASLCPYCYAMVPPRHTTLPNPLNLSGGRIASHGWTVEVSDQYIFTHLFVSTPRAILHSGPEPGRNLTPRGLLIVQIGPLIGAALLLAIAFPTRWLPPLVPVALLLTAAIVHYLRLRWSGTTTRSLTDRAVDSAWEVLTPELHPKGYSKDDANLLGSLARASIGHGTPSLRTRAIERACARAEREISRNDGHTENLAALRLLEMHDARRMGRDPLTILAREIGNAIAGRLPLAYAEQLLEAWPDFAGERRQQARLRVMLCARAFESGFEGRDLSDLGRLCPAIGDLIDGHSLAGLARLRWLWNVRAERPWRHLGSATTVFELAKFPALGELWLHARPDLLLFQPMSVSGVADDGDAGTPILICEEGVVYRDLVIRDANTPIRIRTRPLGKELRYELLVGDRSLLFREEPAMLENRLREWQNLVFGELLPGAQSIEGRSTPALIQPLVDQQTILCPECGRSFLALRGNIGILTNSENGS